MSKIGKRLKKNVTVGTAIAAGDPTLADWIMLACALFVLAFVIFCNVVSNKTNKPVKMSSVYSNHIETISPDPRFDYKRTPIHTNAPDYWLKWDTEKARHEKYGAPYVP
ncbi:MAG: hypothetical protein IJU47_06650 [Verrucomicrobia bacterium]|nr:hypothetical protein [Verrucomicrobiota bacterium]